MERKDNECRYMITAGTDPYHSKTRCPRGAKVLEMDGAAPTEWVQDDNCGHGYTLEEALERLGAIAEGLNGGQTFWKDDETAKVEVPVEVEDGDGNVTEGTETVCPDGYEGPGWYDCDGELIYKIGDRSFSYDVMSYHVEELGDGRA